MATPAPDCYAFANQDTIMWEAGRHQHASFAKVSAPSDSLCMRLHNSKQSTFVGVHERGPLMRCENVKGTGDQSSQKCSNACSRCLSDCCCDWLLWNCLVTVIQSVTAGGKVTVASWCVFATFEVSMQSLECKVATRQKYVQVCFSMVANRFMAFNWGENDCFGKFWPGKE